MRWEKRAGTTSKGCIFKSWAESGLKEMIRWEPIIINKHDYVNRTWVIISFPPDITDEKDMEDRESFFPSRTISLTLIWFILFLSFVSLRLLWSKLIARPFFCNLYINTKTCFCCLVAQTIVATPQDSFTVGHTGSTLHKHFLWSDFPGSRFSFERWPELTVGSTSLEEF